MEKETEHQKETIQQKYIHELEKAVFNKSSFGIYGIMLILTTLC